MDRKTEFVTYRPKTILNKARHADHWFWSRYSAYPYKGCQHGCAFCYCREQKYSPYEDVDDFSRIIQVKENAGDLLRSALGKISRDLLFTGDYQPAERKFRLSRRMLEVCCELGFPVFILERSPLVVRDLDLLDELQKVTGAVVVAFSAIHTPESKHAGEVGQLEGLAPPPEERFTAMEEIARHGILTGTCLMPALPGLCDDESSLESVVRWTAGHGGKFVLASGLTLSDQQSRFFLQVLQKTAPSLVKTYQELYTGGRYTPGSSAGRELGVTVRNLCLKFGIRDRIPRPILPDDRKACNKQVAEFLADEAYRCELEGRFPHETWSYRRAAWAVDDLEQDIRQVVQLMGVKGLQRIKQVGPKMAELIAGFVGRMDTGVESLTRGNGMAGDEQLVRGRLSDR